MASCFNAVQGGFSISDEMCVNYVHYYPLVDLEICKSSVTTKSLYHFFEFLKELSITSCSKVTFESVRMSGLAAQYA